MGRRPACEYTRWDLGLHAFEGLVRAPLDVLMKTLIVSLIIWTFIVPCVIAMYLILSFLGAFMPNLCLALIGLVFALVNLVITRGLLCIPKSSRDAAWLHFQTKSGIG